MEKKRLTDGTISLTGLKVRAERTVEHHTFKHGTEGVLTYKPYEADGSKYDTNELVYGLMIIAAYDMLEVGKVFVIGDRTASELAGTNGHIHAYLENGNADYVDYHYVNIETKTFRCHFTTRQIFEQIAEWEGVMGLTAKNVHKFRCTTNEVRMGSVVKPYKRCHGYHPRTISLVMDERRINQKFEVLGKLYNSLTSEGMRKAMSVIAAARLFDNKSYEVKALIKRAMRWKLWKDYARPDAAAEYSLPISFSETDFQCGPDCYKQVDTKYVQALVDYWNKMVADSPMPEWPKQGDWVQFKNREKMTKKYQGKYLCEGMTASLSTYGDRIEWRASLRVKKYDNEYFMPGQLEPWVDPKKSKVTQKAQKTQKVKPAPKRQPSDIEHQTSIAEQLRQALLQRLSA